jgi:RsiW-degrading membrane proteinase PrsW (M82 family)
MIKIFLTIMIILFVIGYFKIGLSINKEKPSKILWLFLMTFIFGILVVQNLALIDNNDELREKVKNKCPEYEKVELYKLKER